MSDARNIWFFDETQQKPAAELTFASPSINQDATEESSLIPSANGLQQEPIARDYGSETSVLRTMSQTALNSVTSLIYYLILAVVSIIPALPQAILAFTPTPRELIKIFRNDTIGNLIFSSAKFISSLTINALMNAHFLPTAWSEIKTARENLSQPLHKTKAFLFSLTALFLGLGAAIGLGAISFETFAWLAEILSLMIAGFTLVMSFASRFVSVNKAFEKTDSLFSTDALLKRKMLNVLGRVNTAVPAVKTELTQKFADIKQSHQGIIIDKHNLSDAEMEFLLTKFAKAIDKRHRDAQSPLKILPETHRQQAQRYSSIALQTTFCALVLTCCALPYSLTYWEKGRVGLRIITDLITQSAGSPFRFENLSMLNQAEFSFFTQLATFCLSGTSMLDLPQTAARTANHVKDKPSDIPKLLLVMAFNVLAAYSPLNLGLGLISEPNEFNFKQDTYGYLLAFLTAAVGFSINTNVSLIKSGLADLPKRPTLRNLQPSHLIHYLDNTTNQPFAEKENLTTLKNLSIFAKKPVTEINPAPMYRAEVSTNP